MNDTLFKALVALVPTCILFSGSVALFVRGRTICSVLQLLGAGCLVVVILTHVSEARHLFPWMHWGLEHSPGSLLGFWERCSWPHFVSRRIFASCPRRATGLTTNALGKP